MADASSWVMNAHTVLVGLVASWLLMLVSVSTSSSAHSRVALTARVLAVSRSSLLT